MGGLNKMDKTLLIGMIFIFILVFLIPIALLINSNIEDKQCQDLSLNERGATAKCEKIYDTCYCTEIIQETNHTYREGNSFHFGVN